MSALADRHGRTKRKLRLSLTDRCNFRCGYCMPEDPEWAPRAQLMSRAELLRLGRLFVTDMGVDELRLTGGEPLLRKDIADITDGLGSLRDAGLKRIALTTNGVLLPRQARALADAGVDDVNVSLDAVDTTVFQRLTRTDATPDQVLDGIEAARAAGLPVKLNAVVIRGHNEDQVLPLVRLAAARGLPLRFIEFMPLEGGGLWRDERVVTAAEILETVAGEYAVDPLPRDNAPADYYRLDDRHDLGVISTVSNPFCASCDRIRLTATGELYSCLFSATGRDLRTPMREGADDPELARIVRGHVWHKQAGYAATGAVERPITMHALGG